MKFSVGICAHNEETNIDQVLHNALEQMNKLGECEVIVVASGCTDRTVEIVRRMAERETGISLIVEKERNGKAHALNLLFEKIRGEILIQVDSDVVPGSGAIAALIARLRDSGVGAASALPIPIDCVGPAGKVSEALWSLHNLTQLMLNREGRAEHLSGQLFAIRRSLCYAIPENVVNDDAFLALRSSGRGYNVVFEPQAQVLVNSARTFRDLLVQRRRIIYGHLMLKRLTGRSPRIFQTCSSQYKMHILSAWLKSRFRDLHSLLILGFLELIAHLLARHDLHDENSHKIWKMAETTKRRLIITNDVMASNHF